MTAAIELLVGIDIGTTNVKCGLYDTSARLVALRTRSTRSAAAGGPLDVEALWRLAAAAAAEAVAAARADRAIRVRGIAVASVGCIPVLLDGGGRPVTLTGGRPDRVDAMARGCADLTPAGYTTITGYPLEPETAVWGLAAGRPEDLARVHSVLSVADYIAYRLTGQIEREFSTSLSYGLWDYGRWAWWRRGLEAIGLDDEVLGQPVASGRPIGTLRPVVARTLGLPRTTLVATGGHDYLAAALAANLRPGPDVLNVSGTVEIMAALHRDPAATPGDGSYRAVKDAHVAAGFYSTMIEAVGAGHVEALRHTAPAGLVTGRHDLAAWFAALDQDVSSDGANRPLYVPARFGEFRPDIGPMPGTFVDAGPDTSGPSLLRAVIEGVCYVSRAMLARQREVLGEHDVAVTMVGGGTRSRAWRQAKADILGTPIRVPRIVEASALGAALLAGVGSGVYRDADEAAATAASLGSDRIEPDRSRAARYEERFHGTFLPASAALAAADAVGVDTLAGHPGEARP